MLFNVRFYKCTDNRSALDVHGGMMECTVMEI